MKRYTIETAEHKRLADSEARRADWKNWGPYLSERAWGTVREDYSATGDAWGYLPHDHARSRAYRWNEDGLAGVCNRFQNLCLAVALWIAAREWESLVAQDKSLLPALLDALQNDLPKVQEQVARTLGRIGDLGTARRTRAVAPAVRLLAEGFEYRRTSHAPCGGSDECALHSSAIIRLDEDLLNAPAGRPRRTDHEYV